MDRPNAPSSQQVKAAMEAGDIAGATKAARAALAAGQVDSQSFLLRGRWHASEGRLNEALSDLTRASVLAPLDAELWTELSHCQALAGHFDNAIDSARAALLRNEQLASAHYSLAFALESMGQLDDAWRSYERAAALDPASTDAVAQLAFLAARKSAWDESRSYAERALAADPMQTIAQFALTMADLGERKFVEAERRARAIIAQPDPQARPTAVALLADALEGQDRTDEAFAARSEQKTLHKALYRGRFSGRQTGSGLALALMLGSELQSLPRTLPLGRADSYPPADGHLFVLGFPRSGTTLLGQILAAHPKVVTLEEKPLLSAAIMTFSKQGGLKMLAKSGEAERAHHRAIYWKNVERWAGDMRGRVLVDQSPLNTLHLPIIAALFPDARIIFAVRDPRDVVLSCFRRLIAFMQYPFDYSSLESAAKFYDATMRFADLARARLPIHVHEVRNEALIADFDTEVRKLCQFSGLDWTDELRDFSGKAQSRSISTPSADQVRRGINSDGVGQWRRHAKYMEHALPLLSHWVERFGYSTD